jgi:dTDP-4-amino-4,6-dideoxygalactose transaminase
MSIPFIDLRSMHAEVRDELDEAWRRVSCSGQFIGGEAVGSFESEWAAYCGTKYCVGVSSGTAALELTLSALAIGRGDEVIVPANTFIATAAAIAAVGARPVFVDVDPSTLLITAEILKRAITRRTAAVIVVHLFGQPADMDSVAQVATSAGIAVVEDAAQAHGAFWKGKKAGGLSHAGCFSFYPAKNLGAFGDAGAVVTNDCVLAERIRSLSNHGRSGTNPYRHELVGANHRLDALQAAILSVKLKRLDDWNAGRRRAAKTYAAELAGLPVQLIDSAPDALSCHHLAVVRTPYRDEVRLALADNQISIGLHYPIPCHRQTPFQTETGPALPVVETAAEQILSLPMFPHLTDAQIRCIADAIYQATLRVAPIELPQWVGAQHRTNRTQSWS